jgi:hypothetical protein
MADAGAAWWRALPAAQTTARCGDTEHVIRWESGRLVLPAHPDTEAELVLATLGGAKARCVELAEMWARYRDDLDVLALGPRWPDDPVAVSWDDVETFAAEHRGIRVRSVPMRRPGTVIGWGQVSSQPTAYHSRLTIRPSSIEETIERIQTRQVELLSLFALGPAFQLRLAGTVAAAWAGRDLAGHRPALAAALTGRLAPAVASWLGVAPGQVIAAPHEGPGWGSLDVTGTGAGRQVRARLPVGWLAGVWACGLAVAAGHLVLAVRRVRWPHAQVLALPAPDAAPVTLDLRAVPPGTPGPGTPGPGTPEPDTPEPNTPGGEAHWVRSESSEEAGSR